MNATWPAIAGNHVVQFYDSEEFLSRSIAAFVAEASRLGGPMVMIVRTRLFQRVMSQVVASGVATAIDLERRVKFVDAEATLEHLLSGGELDRHRLERAFESLLGDAARIDPHGTLWIVGEMVDLLCKRGRREEAVDLEVQWNRLCSGRRPIFTACSYGMGHFADDVDGDSLLAVCRQHTHVSPTERIADAPDERTRFERIALLEQRVRALDPRLAPSRPMEPAAAATAGRTVYVIDDDVSVRRALGRLLASVNLASRTFDSAEAFLEDPEVDRTAGGCLIVDVQLLGMSGLELQQRLGDMRERWPIIAMSGALDTLVEQDALRSGAVTFLRKPFAAQALLDAIATTRR